MTAPEQLLLLEPSPREAIALSEACRKRAERCTAHAERWHALGFDRIAAEFASESVQQYLEAETLAVYAECFAFEDGIV